MKEFSSPAEASNWLKEGKILIHPTEGVWGLGCDASNIKACEKIALLKQRSKSKNFILLAPSISFAIDCSEKIKSSKIELSIFNIKGNKIFKLYEGYKSAGEHSLTWNGIDSNQKAVPSGVYFLKMKTKNNSKIRKMILTK